MSDSSTSDLSWEHMLSEKDSEAAQLLEKLKILTEALELIRDNSDDWHSKMIAYNALEEVIKIK